MSSVVNKSKNKFVPKAKARHRLGAPVPHPAPAPSAPPPKPVEESIAPAARPSVVPEVREKAPTPTPTPTPTPAPAPAAIPMLRAQQQPEEQHEPPPRPRSGIPGLRTTGAVPAVVPGARAASEGGLSELVVCPQRIPTVRSSAAPKIHPTTVAPAVRSSTVSEEGVKVTEGGGQGVEEEQEEEEETELIEEDDDTVGDSEFVQQPKKRKTPQKRKPKVAPTGEPALKKKKKKTAARKKRPATEPTDPGAPPVDGEAAQEGISGEGESSAAQKPKKKRAPPKPKPQTGAAKPRGRRRAESPEDGESQEIAVNVVKMKDLCRDLRIGKKSKRYHELQQMDFTKLAREQEERAERERRIANGEEEEGEGHETTEMRLERLAGERSRRTMNAPQMRIVNGQIVLDDESLHIDRRERDAVDESVMEVVEENQNSRLVNSQTWSKREKVEKWDASSTERFYEALSMFGTDFEIISRMFAGRSRRQMRNKFNNEERKNPGRITTALRTRISVNIEEYSVMADQVFAEPQELEDELQKLRDAHEADELAAAGHAVAMEKERQEVANALMHEGDNAAAVEQGKKTRKKKGTKEKAGAGQEEEVLTMTREEYEAERARELAEAEEV